MLDQKALALARRPIGVMGKVDRVAQLVRHYDSRQILLRAANLLGRKLRPGKRVGSVESDDGRLTESENVALLAGRIVEMQSDHPSHSQCDIESGTFVMLNESILMPGRFDSEMLKQKSHLWRFQFHYHEFLLTQAAKGNWSGIRSFLTGWLSEYAPEKVQCSHDSWHPYCISRRLVAWIWLLNVAGDDAAGLTPTLAERLLNSMVQQANYLSRNLERDLGGNHLLENATALAIASGTVDSTYAKRWGSLAKEVLAAELPIQVLSHGEHFELSPMYHCQILSNLLRIEVCCQDDESMLEVVSPFIDPMLRFLRSILHPDGEIPLFADSGFFEAPSVSEIVAVAKLTGRTFSAELEPEPFESVGGYQVFRGKGMFAICDFGPVAAKSLPAHGHCDATNLEVSIEGHRWIVDSGNFNYADDSMRHYCRSSIGHNVVTVNDQNQANVWSKFRMGDRPTMSGHRQGVRDGFCWATVAHDGYRKLGIRVSRLVAFGDTAAICFDRATGSNVAGGRLVGYLHFHPEVLVTRETDKVDGVVRFKLARGSTEKRILFLADEATIEQGWYCTGFGRRSSAAVVRYVRADSTQLLGWILHELNDDPVIEYSSDLIEITIGDSDVTWTEFAK